MTAEPIVHRKGAFGGAVETMIPVQEAARKAVEEMKARGNVDAIIPLTHQDMADDVVRPYFSPTFQSPEHPTFFFLFSFFLVFFCIFAQGFSVKTQLFLAQNDY